MTKEACLRIFLFSFSSQVLRLVQTGFSGDRLSGLLVGIDRRFGEGVTTRDIDMPASWSFLVEIETYHLLRSITKPPEAHLAGRTTP